MKNQAFKSILFILVIPGVLFLNRAARAEEKNAVKLINRPVMEYNSDKLRDPFKTYMVKEEPVLDPQANNLPVKLDFDTSKLQLQGVVWGVKKPQAIINDKVVSVGDLIEGAEIVNIDKKGVTLDFNGRMVDLTAPGQISTQTGLK
jgi:hypothetical protein